MGTKLAKILIVLGVVFGALDLFSNWLSPIDDLSSSDMVVAVSGGNTAARAEEAISVYKSGYAQKIVFLGAAFDPDSPSNAAVMKNLALGSGVSSKDIIIGEQSKDTEENAAEFKKIGSKFNVKKIILVTSSYHQRRTLLEFKSSNPNIKIINHPVNDSDWPKFWWLTPRGWWLSGSEFLKILAFYL